MSEEPGTRGSRAAGSARGGDAAGRAALVIAHPGHELRVHGWLERTRPVVFVLTDGSGAGLASRLPSTAALLDRAGAVPGSIFGRLTDAALYTAVLEGRSTEFLALLDELVGELAALDVSMVAGDALEGYNPAHDLTRYLIDAAVRILRTRHHRRVLNCAFPLSGPPDAVAGPAPRPPLVEPLDEAAFRRKLRAAEAYGELDAEVRAVLATLGPEPFRTECLVPVREASSFRRLDAEAPFYERHGARRVAEGRYRTAIRYREHVRPIAAALWAHARAASAPPIRLPQRGAAR